MTPLSIEGAWKIQSNPVEDERGSFARLWCSSTFREHGLPDEVVQVSQSFNRAKATLRGMHFQKAPHLEAKWVRCTQGAIYDVLLDLRPDSPTCGTWTAIELKAEDLTQVFIPKGVAHGFMTLTDHALVHYSISDYYVPEAASGVRWNDPAFQIEWPMQPAVISQRDANYPLYHGAPDECPTSTSLT